jgi:hypothetical protein
MGPIALLTIVPEERFAVVVLTNADYGDEVTLAASKRALEAYCGIEDPEPAAIPRGAEELAEFAGRYSAQLNDIELAPEDGGLRATLHLKGGFPTPDTPPPPPLPPGRLVFHDGDRVSGEGELEGARGEFLRDENGNIAWFRFGGRLYRPQR